MINEKLSASLFPVLLYEGRLQVACSYAVDSDHEELNLLCLDALLLRL